MLEFTKGERKELNRLSGIAYQEEMAIELTRLEANFTLWREKEIDVIELDERIHKYHDNAHRALYKRYVMSPQHHLNVARALALKLIPEESVSPQLHQKIKPLADWIRNADETSES